MAPVGCAVALPISGQLSIEGIPVLGLVDTGASVTCLGFAIWWRYRAQWGALKPFESAVHGAHGKPLNIAGRTEHLDIQWGEARGRASFIVIVGLESPPCLIGMDTMRPLRVHIDVTKGTATPAQPDPQTIHLNAAQTRQPQKRFPHRQLAHLLCPRKTRHQELLSRPPGQLYLPLLCPSDRKIRWQKTGVQLSLHRQIFLQLLLNTVQHRPTLSHHLTWLTLTRLAVLGCSRQQIFLPRQLALCSVTTHGHLRTSFFALMVLSRLL